MAFYMTKNNDIHRGVHVTTFSPAVVPDGEAVERPIMIKPNNLEYFYDEKEDDENVYDTHRRLNMLWAAMSAGGLVFFIWAMERGYRQ